MSKIIDEIEKAQLKADIPEFRVGDSVRISSKIKEGEKQRIQLFEGVVLKRQNGGVRETFTVRKIVAGSGVEKTFFVHSPMVAEIKVLKKGKVRRAKLHYLRERIGTKAIRIKTRGMLNVKLAEKPVPVVKTAEVLPS